MIKIKGFSTLVFLLIGFQHQSNAQIEEIVVTASSTGGEYYGMPAVTITKTADFLVQNIRLINDSRSPELRQKEIIGTIEELIDRSTSMRGMALSYGDGFLEPIDLNNDSIQLLEDRQRVDTSYVDIYAKIELDPNKDSTEQIENLREFISGVQKIGRTEIDPLGDIGLSIVGPEKYRYEIIKKISEENTKLRDTLGDNCKISIGGLEGRVEWERTSVSELTLYISYGLEISECS